jgi:hypothetical protein
MTLSAVEFIRRFLLHVLPERFVRIRYYGLHHSAARAKKLPQARALLGLERQLPRSAKLTLTVWLASVLGEAYNRCHWCGTLGSMTYRAEAAEVPVWWFWLKRLFGLWFEEELRRAAQAREAEAEAMDADAAPLAA